MKLTQLITLAFLLLAHSGRSQTKDSHPKLGVGSQVSEYPNVTWLKGERLSKFEKHKIYIIECWATWCGPCMGAIPHLNELHKKYGDQINIIGQGVMENDLTKVRKFVEEKGDDMAYNVAFSGGANSDFAQKWLVPSEVKGIPQTFVIQDNQIVWMPSPVELTDEAIELLLQKKFSLENLRAAEKVSKINVARSLLKTKNFEKVLSVLDSLILKNPDNGEALAMKYNALDKMGKTAEAVAYLEAAHQKKLRIETFLHYYRSLNNNRDQSKLLRVLENDIDRCLADNNSLVADVIVEAYKTYAEMNDYPGLTDFIKRVNAKSSTSRPLFAVVAISPYYPVASPLEAKPVNAAVFAAATKLLSMSQMEFHYLIGCVKMFWQAGEKDYARKLIQSSIAAAKRDNLPKNSVDAIVAIANSLKKGLLPTDEEFQQLEEDAKK